MMIYSLDPETAIDYGSLGLEVINLRGTMRACMSFTVKTHSKDFDIKFLQLYEAFHKMRKNIDAEIITPDSKSQQLRTRTLSLVSEMRDITDEVEKNRFVATAVKSNIYWEDMAGRKVDKGPTAPPFVSRFMTGASCYFLYLAYSCFGRRFLGC